MLLFLGAHKLELTLPHTTTTSHSPQSGRGGTELRSPYCPLVMADCQNPSPGDHVQHLTGLLGELRPLPLIRRFRDFFPPFSLFLSFVVVIVVLVFGC